ncbi:hypothetical protein J2X65_001660 [Ancylobacter sp. 3268]|uniref:hypothetical protein n=1 Tax=Ancylobacter sp. 3268 TaxID=2817752 RepID=UPI002861AE0D|nr:hypothetical protein [Ancylobacter sp. 3268]MDR6952305.1 hypothetical protein [Ancylobacter sp. 3268]
MDADVVSKGQFATLCNVSAGRVSQWIAEGKITGDALVGEGRGARIRVQVAQSQLRQRIDIGQRFGNGLDTNLQPAPSSAMLQPAPATSSTPTPLAGDPVEEKIKRERLREIEYRNRRNAEQELQSRGTLMLREDAAREMAKIATGMLTVFEGAMPDFAAALAAQFGLPQRDILHLLRRELRGVRERAALAARKHAAELPAEVSITVDEEPAPTVQ